MHCLKKCCYCVKSAREAVHDGHSSTALVGTSSDDEPVRPSVSQKSFSGSGLNLELSLASGQEIELNIRINQA